MLIESLGTYLAIRKNESGGTGVLGQSMNGWRITFTACIGNVEDEMSQCILVTAGIGGARIGFVSNIQR